MQDSSAGAAVLIVVVAVLFAAGFVTFWLRDRGRAHEVSSDPGRTRPGVPSESRPRAAREGAAEEPPVHTERRH